MLGGRPPATEGHSMPLAAVAEQYVADLRTRAKPRTISSAASDLARIVADLGVVTVGEIRKVEVIRWRQRRAAAGAANKTVNTQLGYLKSALNFAVLLEQIPTNPLNGIRKLPTAAHHQKRRPRALSEWEIARLLAAAAALDLELGGFPREPLVFALILTGVRWGALIQATWGDLDSERATLTLRAETEKGFEERVIPLRADLIERLLGLAGEHIHYTGQAPTPAARIFLAPRGAPWRANSGPFLKHLLECYARAGILQRIEKPRTGARGPPPKGRVQHVDAQGRHLNVHTLRHTFSTRLARADIPIQTAQVLTGHKTGNVLLGIYTHLRAEEARSAIDCLPAVGGNGSLARAESGGDPRPSESVGS